MKLHARCGNCGKRAPTVEQRVQRSPRVVAVETRCTSCGTLLDVTLDITPA